MRLRKKIVWKDDAVAVVMGKTGKAFFIYNRHPEEKIKFERSYIIFRDANFYLISSKEEVFFYVKAPKKFNLNNDYIERERFKESLIIRHDLKEKLDILLK